MHKESERASRRHVLSRITVTSTLSYASLHGHRDICLVLVLLLLLLRRSSVIDIALVLVLVLIALLLSIVLRNIAAAASTKPEAIATAITTAAASSSASTLVSAAACAITAATAATASPSASTSAASQLGAESQNTKIQSEFAVLAIFGEHREHILALAFGGVVALSFEHHLLLFLLILFVLLFAAAAEQHRVRLLFVFVGFVLFLKRILRLHRLLRVHGRRCLGLRLRVLLLELVGADFGDGALRFLTEQFAVWTRHIHGLAFSVVLSHHFKSNRLPNGQSAEVGDCSELRVVHKHIAGTVVTFDEAEAFLRIEFLAHASQGHRCHGQTSI